MSTDGDDKYAATYGTYQITFDKPGTFYLLADSRRGTPGWFTSDGYTNTGVSIANSRWSHFTHNVWSKEVLANDTVTTGDFYGSYEPLGFAFMPSVVSFPTFTSVQTGDWDTLVTWDDGSGTPAAPPAVANPVEIVAGHVVTVATADADATADSVSVDGVGAELIVESPRILGVTNSVAIGPAGKLSGTGSIVGPDVAIEGTIAAGTSPGTLTIGAGGFGDLSLVAGSTLITEVGDLIAVEGNATIDTTGAGATLTLASPAAPITNPLDTRLKAAGLERGYCHNRGRDLYHRTELRRLRCFRPLRRHVGYPRRYGRRHPGSVCRRLRG